MADTQNLRNKIQDAIPETFFKYPEKDYNIMVLEYLKQSDIKRNAEKIIEVLRDGNLQEIKPNLEYKINFTRTYSNYYLTVKKGETPSLGEVDNEVLQSFYLAAGINGSQYYFYEELEKFGKDMVLSKQIDFKELYERAGPDWHLSSRLMVKTALSKLKFTFNNKMKIIHPSADGTPYHDLYKSARACQKVLTGKTFKDDKWNPGDIWIMDLTWLNNNFKAKDFIGGKKSLTQLNDIIFTGYKKSKILPLSLKKVKDTTTVKFFNGDKQYLAKVSNINTGKGDFLSSKLCQMDVAVNGTKYGFIFRTNTSRPKANINGEIVGKEAQGGKVKFLEIVDYFPKFEFTPYRQINEMTAKPTVVERVEKLYEIGTKLKKSSGVVSNFPYKSLTEFANVFYKNTKTKPGSKEEGTYLISKLQACQSVFAISESFKKKPKETQDIIQRLIDYAIAQISVTVDGLAGPDKIKISSFFVKIE
jgi:hypothetical protein